MLSLPHALIIVGTDRNAGKTTFASRIISSTSKVSPVIGVKISPHFHSLKPTEDVILRTDNFIIVRENDPYGDKDSSRFLGAGASEVYYMQVWDQDLPSAFGALLKFTDAGVPMVIESGWLRRSVEPGKFVIVNKLGNKVFKENIEKYRQLPHIWTEFDGEFFTLPPEMITWKDGAWH